MASLGCFLIAFLIMGGGVTPLVQPLDVILNKIYKGYYRELYDLYMLNAPLNDKGHPISPSRQLCAQWAVKAWDRMPTELVVEAWKLCGCKSMEEIKSGSDATNQSLTLASPKAIVQTVEKIAGGEASGHFLNPDNGDEVLSLGGFQPLETVKDTDKERGGDCGVVLEEGTWTCS